MENVCVFSKFRIKSFNVTYTMYFVQLLKYLLIGSIDTVIQLFLCKLAVLYFVLFETGLRGGQTFRTAKCVPHHVS